MSRRLGTRPILSSAFLMLLGVILAIGLAACGSGGGSSSESSSTATTAKGETEGGGTKEEPAGEEESFGAARSLADLYKGNQETPPTSGPPAQKGKFVVYVSCGQVSPGCAVPAEGLEEAAKVLGWKTQLIDGKEGENNGWINGIRDAIALHPDAIAMVGLDCPGVKAALLEAKAANIPVYGSEEADCDEVKGGEGEPSLLTIPNIYSKTMKKTGEYFETWGSFLTEYIINKTEGKADLLYLNVPGIPITESWKAGSQASLANCPECKFNELSYGINDLSVAGNVGKKVETALLKDPETNSVQFNQDVIELTGGGAKAIVNSGRKDDIVVSGGEGSVEALELIHNESGINAEIGLPLNWLGWAAADEINRYFAGEPPAPEGIGFQIIDKEHNLPPEGEKYVPEVEYKSAYEKSWGG